MSENKLQKNRLIGIYKLSDKSIMWINSEKEYVNKELLGKNLTSGYVDRYEPNYLIMEETVRTRPEYYLYHLVEKSLTKITLDQGNLALGNRLDNNRWLGMYYSSNQPITPVILEDKNIETLKSSDLVILFDNFSQSSLNQSQLTNCKEYKWESIDEDVYGWLYEPKGDSKGLIVYVHGGPTSQSNDSINHEIQFYVHKGYHVLDPNYRGSTGYGVKFQELIKDDGWGGNEQLDIANGVKALIDENVIKKGKVAITGTSYGGYSAWFAITKYPDVFDISIPVCGMTDLVIDYETTRPDLRPYSESMLGGSPSENPEKYYNSSPINFIQNIKGKLLIIQGANDPNVHPKNVEAVENALREAEVEYEISIYDDEGHGISKKQNKIRKYLEIHNFVNSMLYDE